MRKIRGFKLALRNREVLRRARKAGIDLAALGLGTDEALTELLSRLAARARPAVLFDSFPFASGGSAAAGPDLAPVPGVAYSLALATLGPELDAFIAEEAGARPERSALLEVAAQAALEDAVRFINSLVEEEARQERCELSPLQVLTEPSALGAALDRLEGGKIGVSLTPEGFRPRHTAAFSLSWLVRPKTRAKSAQ